MFVKIKKLIVFSGPIFMLYFLAFLLSVQLTLALKECESDDFKYEYTPCDANGLRWRVAVPKQVGLCQGGQPPPPEQGKNCTFTCKPGHYLDVSTQQCTACRPGNYSLGGGIRFDAFDTMPKGFTVTNKNILMQDNGLMTSNGEETKQQDHYECRNGTGWSIEKGYLLYIPEPYCMSTLTYTVDLNREGAVQYTYRRPDRDNVMVTMFVQNDQCAVESYNNKDKPEVNEKESGGAWVTNKHPLRAGHNVIKWHGLTFNSLGEHQDALEPVLVDNIEIYGMPYITECSQCPAGTFSTTGKADCNFCLQNTYSSKGASTCTKCQTDEYSDERAWRCETRPPCTNNDYFGKWGQCSSNKMTVTFDWIKPKICKDDLQGSVHLPAPETRDCGSCNPGMAKDPTGQKCNLCQKQTYSDGRQSCQLCPPNTAPNYGYQFVNWDRLPEVMKTYCEAYSRMTSATCTSDSWLPAGNKIHTAYTRTSDVILRLELQLQQGFWNPLLNGRPSATNPIGHVTFQFETTCQSEQCALYFVESPANSLILSGEIVAQWNGTRSKQAYRYAVSSANARRFSWIFVRSETDYSQESASIYFINVTNIGEKVGASTCIQCPIQASLGSGCLPCPPGHAMDSADHSCKKCSMDTVVNGSTCIKCGANLHSVDGVSCALPPLLNITVANTQRTFNMTALPPLVLVHGVSMFTGGGDSYSHVFNLSLPVQSTADLARSNVVSTCADTVTLDVGKRGLMGGGKKVVTGLVCRATSIPNRGGDSKETAADTTTTSYTMSMLLASKLLGISSTAELAGWKLGKKELSSIANHDDVLHVFYGGEGKALDRCPNGLALVVSLVCDPGVNATRAQLPSACPDGTCDGCLYHIIVTSSHACPICTPNDYTQIKGECHFGLQKIHKIPAKHCVLSGKVSKTVIQTCKVFGVQAQVAVGLAATFTVLLCSTLIYVCRKNKKLEYKYMKLVEHSEHQGEEGELPAAESCALQEGEEEEEVADRVIFAKGRKKTRGMMMGRSRVSSEEKRAFAFDQEGPED